MRRRLLISLIAVLVLTTGAKCKKDEPPVTPPPVVIKLDWTKVYYMNDTTAEMNLTVAETLKKAYQETGVKKTEYNRTNKILLGTQGRE